MAQSAGIKPETIRWVDVNKGDEQHMKVCSRLVARQLKARTKEAFLAQELFSAMPPWEMIKSLFSLLVTDDMDQLNSGGDTELEMGIFDISRAHFMPKVECQAYVEIPEEDKNAEDGDVVGKLNRNMYGRRTAAHSW